MSDPKAPSPYGTYFIMKLVAFTGLVLGFGLLYYYNIAHEQRYQVNTQRYVPALGPHSARPNTHNLTWLKPNGDRAYLSDFKGQVVYINFWAIWCEPCIVELPIIERLQEEYGPMGFQTILINMDHGERSVLEARAFQALNSPSPVSIYEQSEEMAQILNVQALPFHILVDREGRTASAFYAPLDTKEAEFTQLIQKLLRESETPENL